MFKFLLQYSTYTLVQSYKSIEQTGYVITFQKLNENTLPNFTIESSQPHPLGIAKK